MPLTPVSAELSDAAGKKKDEGIGVAGADGTATVQFILGDDPIRPGDVALSRNGGKPLRVTVPALSAAADAAAGGSPAMRRPGPRSRWPSRPPARRERAS
ncbi:MAG: hypothetical protein U0470_06520 [Anaerolineae bacterium]